MNWFLLMNNKLLASLVAGSAIPVKKQGVSGFSSAGGLTPLIDDTGLKAYYKFTEGSSPFLNHSESDDKISDSDLVVTDDSEDGITYEESTVAGNIPVVARWTSSSATDGAYAEAGVASDWNFLHYNSANTNNQPYCTILFWFNTGAVLNNTTFFTTTSGDASSGWRGLNYYISNWEGGGATWRIFVSRSGGKLYQIEAPDDYIDADNAWHFYSLTYDGSTMSLKKDLADELTASVSGSPASGDAFSPLCFQHINEGSETYIPPPNNTAEFSIWDRVLTSAELITVYNSGNGNPLYS